jgi:ribosomal protein L13
MEQVKVGKIILFWDSTDAGTEIVVVNVEKNVLIANKDVF